MNHNHQHLLRRITAYHEAAHTVVALRFNVRVVEVALHPHIPGAGHMNHAGVPLEWSCEHPVSLAQQWRVIKNAVEKRIMILLAGALAEGKLHGSAMRTEGARSDMEEIEELCVMLVAFRRQLNPLHPIPADETRNLVPRLRRKTRRLLGQPKTWRAVSTLAEDLMQWRILTGDDAADTVQYARQRPGQLSLPLPLPVRTANESNSRRWAHPMVIRHQ